MHHYTRLERPEAGLSLIRAIDEAMTRIERNPGDGLPAPRPYPDLAQPGERWIKVKRYWIAYSVTSSPEIRTVFYDAADIPGRL